MKRVLTYLVAVIFLAAFTTPSGIDEVINALKTGNTAQIARLFDETVEITISNKSNNYSKSQAELVLKDFFNNNPVKGFEVIHKGENGGSQYCIGTLITKGGSFRTTLFMKQKGDKQLLQGIRFESP